MLNFAAVGLHLLVTYSHREPHEVINVPVLVEHIGAYIEQKKKRTGSAQVDVKSSLIFISLCSTSIWLLSPNILGIPVTL
jgi:hypothetical protein